MTGKVYIATGPEEIGFLISWAGGTPPFQLQESPSLTSPVWTNVGPVTMKHERQVPNDKSQAFFRLMEAVPLLDADVSNPNETRLIWQVPELE